MNEQAIFLAALDIADLAERAAYVNRTCAGDPTLSRQVEALLTAHERSGEFLDVPALQQIAAGASEDWHSPDETSAGHHDNKGEVDLSFLQPSTQPGSLGRLGHYEVQEVIGRGGCGIVLKAFDEILHRMVAIKVMAPELAANSPARKRFLREARAAAAIRHENVVSIHAVEEKPIPFLVMEYIAGQTLQQKLDQNGPLDIQEVVQIGHQVANGLEAAHAIGLIHRDIKPGNILLEKGRDRIKITDFGLARATDDASITQSGVIAGTPLYMSPEQAQGAVVDQRSDLFSLGSVLYVMCSGRPPFRAATTLAVLKRVAEDQPRAIQEIIPEVPDWLVAIIAKLHAKAPTDRFASAQEIADLLSRCLSELQHRGRVESLVDVLPMIPKPATAAREPVPSASPMPSESPVLVPSKQPPLPRSRRWVAAAAMILVLFAGLGMTEATGVTNVRGTVIRLFSPDGTLVVEVDDPGVSVSVDGEELVITGTGAKEIRLKPGQYTVLASKDGKLVRQELVTVTRNGRQVVRVSKEMEPATVTGDRPNTEAPLPTRFKNTLGMEFALILKGKAWLGGGGGIQGNREVEFQDDFYLGVYEVTQEEWEKVMEKNPSYYSRMGGGKIIIGSVRDEHLLRLPVENVSWQECQEFVIRLNEQLKEKGWKYRLPTEVEWEYACRDGAMEKQQDAGFDFYAGSPSNTLDPKQANFLATELGRPNKVGSYSANRLGLYDMHGNIEEWCEDALGDVMGLPQRVHRGGYFNGDCKAKTRSTGSMFSRSNTIGLRVARVRVGTSDPDRRAAEWVLSIGGRAGVNDQDPNGAGIAEMPKEPFRLTFVNFQDNQRVTDAGLANFQDCKNLTFLHLGGVTVTDAGVAHFKDCKNLTSLTLGWTAVTDAGLANFQDCKNLTGLDVGGTKVTDAGLANFKDCKNLAILHLYSTRVTDAGLAHLQDCKNLTLVSLDSAAVTDAGLERLAGWAKLVAVNVKNTRVTADGVKKLSAALPKCRIDWDGGTIKSKVTADPDRRAAEWVLSIGGGISIKEKDQERQLGAAADLPQGPFELTVVNLILNSKVSDSGLAQFADCKNLTSLDLAATKVSDAGLVHFKDCKDLTSLVLRHAPLSDAGLVHFADCKNLMILDLNDTKVSDAGLAHFKNCKNLTELHLALTQVSDAGLAHFEDCKNLTYLDLGSTQVSDAGLAHFEDRKNLTYLVLNSTKVSDAGLAHFKDCKNLTGLHLGGTQVSDAGLTHFKDCKNFTILNLGAPQVSDAGLTHFKDCKNLFRLDLSGTKVSDAGLANLAGCPKLGSLSVHNTKVTEAGVKELSAALPGCKIEWDGGVIEPKETASTKP